MEPSQAWIEALARLEAEREPCALVVVVGGRGSVPREPGARMIVTADGLRWGTIGGGRLEQQAIARASELLAIAEPRAETQELTLSESVGQCCGGKVSLYLETFHWRRPRVVVFGAGHVGQALGGLAPWLDADVLLIDGRDEEEIRPPIPAERPYELLCIDHPEAELDGLPSDALVLVMTHDHGLDLEIVARALARGGFAYLGLIGSERKWDRFRRRLRERGFTDEQIARVRCPIGLVKGSKEPRAIALSAAAELVEVLAARGAGAASPR